jgi:hypothetical protein
MVPPSVVHQLREADRHRLLCQIEDDIVVTLVCTPDGEPLNSAMVAALEWVQERH